MHTDGMVDGTEHTAEACSVKRSTSELMMHCAIYRIHAIAHIHSRTATTFAVMNKPISTIVNKFSLLGYRED